MNGILILSLVAPAESREIVIAVFALLITALLAILLWWNNRARRALETARTRAEEASRQSQQQLQSILDNTTAVVFVKDIAGRYLHINRQYEILFHTTREQIVGKTDHDIFPKEQADAFRANDLKVLAKKSPIEFDEIAPHDDGPHHYISIKFPLFDANGAPRAVCGISTDITRRKRVERRLAVQYALTRILAEGGTLEDVTPKILRAIGEDMDWRFGALWVVDREARVLRLVELWHDPALKAPAFETKSRGTAFPISVGLPGRVWASATPAWIEDVTADANFPRTQSAAQDGLHGAFAFPILLGQEIHGVIEFFSPEVRKPDEEVLEMFVAVGSQIGQFIERSRAREALSRERDLLQALMDNVPDNIYFKDVASRFTRINKCQARLLGVRDPREALGKTDFDYLSHAPEAFADEQHLLSTGKPLIGKIEKVTNAEGQSRYLSATKAPLFDKHGKPIGIVGISRDITELEQAREQLAQYAEEMRKRNEQVEADLDMARGIQQVMLPKQFSSFPRGAVGSDVSLRFSHRYCPVTKLGGDFFDMLPLSQTEAGVFVSDVMGHGVRAALVTAMMRALVEEQSPVTNDPGKFLAKINMVLLGILRQAEVPTFASAFYMVVDVARGEIRYANAGHPAPLHLRRGMGTVEPLTDGAAGPALGLFEEAIYATYRRPVAVNDLVMLFTDGLFEVEGANKQYYGQERLLEDVRKRITTPSPKLFAELLAEIPQFSVTGNFTDDVCLVAVEVARLG